MQTDKVHYIYEGPLVIEERGTNNLPQVTYTRGRDMSGSLNRAGGIGGLMARTDWTLGVTDYYHADADGNVTTMINPAQVVTARYLYDPYGNTLAVVGARGELNRMRFSSKEANPDFNLVFYEYRTYDPVTQRWLQRDPIEERGGINLYGFVGNSPVNFIDSVGLDYYGNPTWPPVVPPSVPYYPPPTPRRPPQYPQGFSLCQRDLQKDSSLDIPTMVGNAIGGEHSYVQYVDSEGNKSGVGFSSAGISSEKHFDPNSCRPCKKVGTLKFGSGAGKSATSASDAEISDCLKNRKASRPYSTFGYNCRDWAKEATKDCGLDCR